MSSVKHYFSLNHIEIISTLKFRSEFDSCSNHLKTHTYPFLFHGYLNLSFSFSLYWRITKISILDFSFSSWISFSGFNFLLENLTIVYMWSRPLSCISNYQLDIFYLYIPLYFILPVCLKFNLLTLVKVAPLLDQPVSMYVLIQVLPLKLEYTRWKQVWFRGSWEPGVARKNGICESFTRMKKLKCSLRKIKS